MDVSQILVAVLVAFYLYLMVRKRHVREPGLYRLGLMGILIVFAGGCFGAGGLLRTQMIIQWVGALWMLFGVAAGCGVFRGPYDPDYRPEGWGKPEQTTPPQQEET